MRYTLIVFSLLFLSLHCVFAVTVTGKVVGADDKPIAGANVNLYLFEERKSLELRTDAEGGYAFDIDLAGRRANTPLATIVAYAPGYTLADATLTAKGDVVTLSAGTTCSGTVVDTAGKPLAGIPVRLNNVHHDDNRGMPDTNIPDAWRSRFTATTAADGAWTLSGLPRDGTVSFTLDDERYVHEAKEITFVAGEQTDAVQFTARPGAIVTGRVLTPEGKPATDARVNIYAANSHPPVMATRLRTAAIASPGWRQPRMPSASTARSWPGSPNR